MQPDATKPPPSHSVERPPAADYRLLPFRFSRVPGVPDEILLTTEAGEWLFLPEGALHPLVHHRLTGCEPFYDDLLARHFIFESATRLPLEPLASQYRTRKSVLFDGPALHMFVVTLRCDHSCAYCQVSRRAIHRTGFDMSEETARLAIDRLFESPSPTLTVEFQGGEPLLAFDRVRFIIEAIAERNQREKRDIRYVVATTLCLLTDEMLAFFRVHNVVLSTSLDGPKWLHDAYRPNRAHDSFDRTIEGLARARAALGEDSVAALTTLTRESLSHPEAIIDAYVENAFHSVFLRGLSPYGFAAQRLPQIGYTAKEMVDFFGRALDYLIRVNIGGYPIDEVATTLLLTLILTPLPTPFVDLRSPAGAGLGALLYNYDGGVYPSDEARMLAEMGNDSLRLGHVGDTYSELYRSPAMGVLLQSAVAEALPGCADCAFVPYCGAAPVDALARQGDPCGYRPTSGFCARQKGLLDLLFVKLHQADLDTIRVFLSWLRHTSFAAIPHTGHLV